MSNLKKWVLVPIACVFGFSVLVVVLAVLSVKVGFLWALLILSVLSVVVAKVLAAKFKGAATNIMGGVGLALICVWGIVGIANVGAWLIEPHTSAPAQTQAQQHTDVDALVEAEHIVSGYLKSPSTAQFPSMSDATIEGLANNGFKVSSYVDSQNGFGAMIRSNWTVLFEYAGNDTVNIYQVIVDGEALYTRDTKSTSK